MFWNIIQFANINKFETNMLLNYDFKKVWKLLIFVHSDATKSSSGAGSTLWSYDGEFNI